MGAPGKRIVEDHNVAGREGDGGDCRRHGHGHGAKVHGHVIAHGNDPGLGIEDGAGVVAPFLDVGGERGAAQGRAHFLGDGMDRALKDCEFNRIDRGAHGALLPGDGDDQISEAIHLRAATWRQRSRGGIFGDHRGSVDGIAGNQAFALIMAGGQEACPRN